MRNVIIVFWIALIGFFAAPVVAGYISGVPESEVLAVIYRESEADEIDITSEEIHGDKAMYCFKTRDDFGVAVFRHFADRYSYDEGTIANGEDHVKVRLDTGWDVYKYDVTVQGAELVEIESSAGNYRIYAVSGAVLFVVTLGFAVYRLAAVKRETRKRI